MESKGLVEVWERVQKAEKLFVLKTDDNLFYVESPDDQGLTVHDVHETILRVFLEQEHGELYKGMIQNYLQMPTDKAKMALVGISLQQLFDAYPKINEDSKKGYSCPIKVILCACKEDEFPETLDTLITNTVVQN